MKKSFAFGEAVGLTPFGPRAPAARRGETAPRLLQNLTPPPA